MSTVKGSPPKVSPPKVSTPVSVGKDAGASKDRSGRTAFDDRGNAVWEWQTEDGDYSRDVSTQRIKKLEAPELSLEETNRLKKLDQTTPKTGMMPGGGFNPYDRGGVQNHSAPPAHKPIGQAGRSNPSKPLPEPPPRKPVKDLKRLQEWMEMKKRLANQKDDD